MAIDSNINRIKFLRSTTSGSIPPIDSIQEGELALNLADRAIYSRYGSNIIELGFSKGGTVTGPITAPEFIGPLSGNAATATKLQTERTINGVSFNGSTDVDLAIVLTAKVDWNTLKKPATYSVRANVGTNRPATNHGTLTIHGIDTRCTQVFVADTAPPKIFIRICKENVWDDWTEVALTTSNVASATKLATARTIAISGAVTGTATSFDGSGNIAIATTTIDGSKINTGTIPAARIPTLNQNTSGNAATATKLANARTINGVAFNGSANITIEDSTKLPLTGGTLSGNLSVTGSITASGNITAFSDITLKDNLRKIDNSLDKLKDLNGFTYTRNDLQDTSIRYAGLIAQDVNKVLPEAITKLNDKLSVDYNAVIGLLVEAVKELADKVDKLENK